MTNNYPGITKGYGVTSIYRSEIIKANYNPDELTSGHCPECGGSVTARIWTNCSQHTLACLHCGLRLVGDVNDQYWCDWANAEIDSLTTKRTATALPLLRKAYTKRIKSTRRLFV